jgi:hypothetical protein
MQMTRFKGNGNLDEDEVQAIPLTVSILLDWHSKCSLLLVSHNNLQDIPICTFYIHPQHFPEDIDEY